MAYGTLKVDTIIYTSGGVDTTTTVSGLANGNFPNIISSGTISGATITGDVGDFTTITAVTGIFTTTLSGATVTGDTGSFTTLTANGGNFTSVTGTTVTGTTANFVTGVFTTEVSSATFTGTTANFVSGVFTTQVSGLTVRGGTAVFDSGNFASGLLSSGIVESTNGGFRFPDGTTQTTAATAGTPGVSLGLVIALGG